LGVTVLGRGVCSITNNSLQSKSLVEEEKKIMDYTNLMPVLWGLFSYCLGLILGTLFGMSVKENKGGSNEK